MKRQILHGDALDRLKNIESDSIDLMCTDPPYGYAFMNRDWDRAVIGVDIWKECLRVLKPGAFAFVMSAPRQDVMSRMIVNLQDARFITSFTPVFWAYASGYIKAMNIGKQIDKKLGKKRKVIGQREDILKKQAKDFERGYRKIQDSFNQGAPDRNNGFKTISADITEPSSPQAKKLDGSYAGFQPKPAVELALVCMKPLSEKNYTEQAMHNGKGITWLDDCRIPFVNDDDREKTKTGFVGKPMFDGSYCNNGKPSPELLKTSLQSSIEGRVPANLLVSDDALNDGKITKSTPHEHDHKQDTPIYGGGKGLGIRKSTSYFNDEGSFSRYFDLDAWFAQHLSQFIITPKASKSEKNKNLDSFTEKKVNDGRKTKIDNPFQRGEIMRKNTHPTVKPIKLFSYLITLGSREHDIILDPFVGSGTAAIACHMLARGYIGIEKEQEYIDIANGRISEFVKTQVLGEWC